MEEEKKFLSQEALEILALLPEGLSEEAQEKCYRVLCRTKAEMASNEMLEALIKISNWELPCTDKYWDIDKKEPMSYETCFGSNGARDYIKSIAKNAIKKVIE